MLCCLHSVLTWACVRSTDDVQVMRTFCSLAGKHLHASRFVVPCDVRDTFSACAIYPHTQCRLRTRACSTTPHSHLHMRVIAASDQESNATRAPGRVSRRLSGRLPTLFGIWATGASIARAPALGLRAAAAA